MGDKQIFPLLDVDTSMRSQENSEDECDNCSDDYDPYADDFDYPAGPSTNAGCSPDDSGLERNFDAEERYQQQRYLASCQKDPEYFDFECLAIEEVVQLLADTVRYICDQLPVTPALAKILLNSFQWNSAEIIFKFNDNFEQLLLDAHIKPKRARLQQNGRRLQCAVCVQWFASDRFLALCCGHQFCSHCWRSHLQTQLLNGHSTSIECMHSDCHLLVPEDFALPILATPDLQSKYHTRVFHDHVKSHPELRFCVGANCDTIIRARRPAAKRASCKNCKCVFCFMCGLDYHTPTACDVIRLWLVKCADDSETANYITAHTKDCPRCHCCIEKNGGCNHMQCWKCKHHFCWMCLGDWKTHGTEYYECSRYKENPNIANEAVHVKAREALQKYLHYYERWENHAKSLRLEQQLQQRIGQRVEEQIRARNGTWIDWQYLHKAAELLTKCRYTLQYTYPYAYYMDNGPRKTLFEYQQGQLEAEIENLSWKVERVESTERGELETQMHVAEQKRLTLLKDFLS